IENHARFFHSNCPWAILDCPRRLRHSCPHRNSWAIHSVLFAKQRGVIYVLWCCAVLQKMRLSIQGVGRFLALHTLSPTSSTTRHNQTHRNDWYLSHPHCNESCAVQGRHQTLGMALALSLLSALIQHGVHRLPVHYSLLW